jgi:GT2 family glycosyltransferase
MVSNTTPPSGVHLVYEKALTPGAAPQRIQGLKGARSEFILFMDDDIVLEDNCIVTIFKGFAQDERVGGVNALITNQHYTKPGFVTRSMYKILSGQSMTTWAGKIIGPAWNLLPEDDPSLPVYVACEWLNTTCTMYRKDALPDTLFPEAFKGYSLLEDVALSVGVGRQWMLLNARTARIFHDSQAGDHKSNHAALAEMELINRHYIMTEVLGRRGLKNYSKLFLFEMFGIVSGIVSSGSPALFIADLRGKLRALKHIFRERTHRNRL